MNTEHRRIEDDPWERKARIIKEFINAVGFPILVSIWLGYQQYMESQQSKKMLVEFLEFKQVIASLKTSIDQQNRILRRRE